MLDVSVIVTLLIKGDPKKLEAHAAADPEGIRAIAGDAEKRGLIAHRFYGSDDGQIMVVDEWPDFDSFHQFFEANGAQIRPLMEAVGATAPPVITSWHKLATGDEVGWNG